MKILITGASGYLGSKLAEAFSSTERVTAVIRSTSSRIRLTCLPVDIVIADNENHLDTIFSTYKPDIVINTVALYGRNGESINSLIEANINYPYHLLTLSQKHQVKAFIHTGTSLPDDISPYALTKNAFVKLSSFQNFKTLKFINVALEHFYGPGDDKSKFTTYVIDECLANNSLKLTEGMQERDFIYIEDVITAYKIIIKKIDMLERVETVSVGSGHAPTVRTLVETIHKNCKSVSELEFGAVAMRENELMYSCADTTRLNKLGWECNHTLEEGILNTIQEQLL